MKSGGIKIGYFLLLAAFFCTWEIQAQRQYRFFYGKVIDNATKLPLSNVNLFVKNARTGTVTDRKGEFSFYLDSIPAILTVSHIGYVTKKIILDTAAYKMTLYLAPEIKTLKEVVISARPQEAVFKDEHYAVLDYEIDSGLVYLLIYRSLYSKAELICRTPGGDTIAKSGLLGFNAKKIVKDCLDNLHVFSVDSVYQVFRNADEIVLIYPVTINKYAEVLSACVASTSDFLYFKRMTNYGLGTEFYTINRKTYSRKWIAQVNDEKKSKMLNRNPEDMGALMSPLQPDRNATTMSESAVDVRAAQEATVEWQWVRKIIYPPVKSFLYRIGDFITIFNTPNRQMEFYDFEGNFSYKVELKLDPAGEGKWTYEILVDPVTLKVYTPYMKSGVVNLYEIDLNTGDISRTITVAYPYPQKLRINENYLYYMYDDPLLPDNAMLFRQRINQ